MEYEKEGDGGISETYTIRLQLERDESVITSPSNHIS
jgi:hypothetical protein